MNVHEKRPFGPGTRRVSFSQVSTFMRCPALFNFRYVKGAPPSHRSGEAVFGLAVHAALAFFHLHLKRHSSKPEIGAVQTEFDELLAVACEGPTPVLWPDDDSIEVLTAQAHELLATYCAAYAGKVLAVEVPFEVQSDLLPAEFGFDDPVAGIIDLIEQEPDGSIVVTEFKTAARRFDDNRLRFDLQVGLYAAVREQLGYPDARLRFTVFLKGKRPSIATHEVRRDPDQIADVGRTMTGVLRAIDARIDFPVRGWQCTTCPYRSACGG